MASTTQKPESEMAEAQHGLPAAPPDNDDLFSFHSDQSAAQWMALNLPQHNPTQALHDTFQPLVEEFGELSQDDPQRAQHTTETLRPYSALWESYAAKGARILHLEKENEIIRAANTQLCQKLDIMERRQANQEALLVCYAKIFLKVREEVVRVLSEGESNPIHPTLGTIENPMDEIR
ncbi:hypothetical protein PMG11_11041 [Penicillium brasilianum]|uniref:Uncharacterized protein n=1 Tax=Penicillium brasilianum TaxID=104259 RepID=A0A0F7U0V6_PENBI|nr:hypothetical protein PMG11_11041 [Penicillium brasilianum]